MCCRFFDPAAPVKSVHSERYRQLLALLIEARQATGLTQAELAKASEVGEITISRLESGKVSARATTVRKLAKALGVKPVDLMPPEVG